MKYTLLQINCACNVSSTGKIAEDIGNLAQIDGYDSYITYALKATRESQNKTIKIHNDTSFWFDVVERMVLDNKGLCRSSNRATIKLIADIERINPDIIHLHTLHYHEVNCDLLWKYLAKKNIPVVYTLHDFWPFTGNCTHPIHFNCDKWQTQCGLCPMPRSYKNSLFLDQSARNLERKKKLLLNIPNLYIITVSKWMEQQVRKSFLKEKKIQTIYNGIDINKFKRPTAEVIESVRSKYSIGSKFMMLGVASSWSIRKGFNDYIRLSKSLNDDEVIVLVGLTAKLIKKLPRNIIGITRTNDIMELAALYAAADVVLNLSYAETFGLTTVEGFACGTPCIGYNNTATPELIKENTGFLIEQGDINALRNALNVVKIKTKEFFSESCIDYAHKCFDKDKNFQNYIQLYNKLLHKSR